MNGTATIIFGGDLAVLFGLAQDEQVVATTEGIGEHSDGDHQDFREMAFSLVGGGAIIIPDGKVREGFGLLAQGLGLGTQIHTTGGHRTTDPNIPTKLKNEFIILNNNE